MREKCSRSRKLNFESYCKLLSSLTFHKKSHSCKNQLFPVIFHNCEKIDFEFLHNLMWKVKPNATRNKNIFKSKRKQKKNKQRKKRKFWIWNIFWREKKKTSSTEILRILSLKYIWLISCWTFGETTCTPSGTWLTRPLDKIRKKSFIFFVSVFSVYDYFVFNCS